MHWPFWCHHTKTASSHNLTDNSRLLVLTIQNKVICNAFFCWLTCLTHPVCIHIQRIFGNCDALFAVVSVTVLTALYSVTKVCYAGDGDSDIKQHNLTISFVAPITSPETPPIFFFDTYVIKKQQSIPMINVCNTGWINCPISIIKASVMIVEMIIFHLDFMFFVKGEL